MIMKNDLRHAKVNPYKEGNLEISSIISNIYAMGSQIHTHSV